MNKPTIKRTSTVKVTTCTLMAGPRGVAKPGTVLNVSDDEAKELIARKFAREYDAQRDGNAKIGLTRAEK